MLENLSSEEKMEHPILAKKIGVGVCEGDPEDGFVIAFNGVNLETKETEEHFVIIPRDGIPELIQLLFTAGINYQKETGIDIGFSDVLEMVENE